jgi:hypothetical protein
MKKYAIIGTWNGEGYSSENKLHSIIERHEDGYVKEFLLGLTKAQMVFGTETIFELENGYGFETEDEDSGTYQFFEIKDDTFGFVVLTNVNEVTMVNEKEFRDMKEEAIEQADLNDYEEGELDSDDVFIGAYGGDYDYQFITMKK